ncbi:alpha/beta hydrolase [Granulicella tundricola]|nr:alpha/beta hydrolase [Granulicella tundricola]
MKSGFLLGLGILGFTGVGASGQMHRHERDRVEATESQNCFDASDPQEIRLWEGRAPGAAGDDPCRDIPYLKVFRAESGSRQPRPVILVVGGGGYDRLTDTKEQAPVAEYFSRTLGVDAFVLYYRLVQKDGTYRYPVPMWDGQRAIKLVRARAAQLGVDPGRVAMFGFSAGGHLASTLALHSASDFDLPVHDAVDGQKGRPDLLGLGYPVISMDPATVPPSGSYKNLLRGFDGGQLRHLQDYLSGEKNVTPHTPPVFLFESMDDARISPQNSVLFVAALRAAGIAVDAHLFAHGEHGAGLAEGIPEESAWPGLFRDWLVGQRFLGR